MSDGSAISSISAPKIKGQDQIRALLFILQNLVRYVAV